MQASLIDAKNFQITAIRGLNVKGKDLLTESPVWIIQSGQYIIKEPDVQAQSRQTCEKSQLVGYLFENKILKVCWKIIMGKRSKTLPFELLKCNRKPSGQKAIREQIALIMHELYLF